MGAYFALILLGVLGLFLVSAGIEDARFRNIANWKNAAIALLAPAFWWANGLSLWPDVGLQVLTAVIVFALFAGAFWLGQMGGGDVKLIGAVALWLPPSLTIWMLIVMSLVGGVLTIVMMVERRWRRPEGPVEVPYGIAIAIATLLQFREPIINQFS